MFTTLEIDLQWFSLFVLTPGAFAPDAKRTPGFAEYGFCRLSCQQASRSVWRLDREQENAQAILGASSSNECYEDGSPRKQVSTLDHLPVNFKLVLSSPQDNLRNVQPKPI